MLKRSRLPMLAIGLAFVLIAAACGGSTTATSDPADTDPPVDTAATESRAPTTTTTAAPEEEPSQMEDEDGSDHEGDDGVSDQEDDGTATGNPDDDDPDPVASDRTVEVIMTDFAFEPNSFTAAAGETVTYNVTNTGVIEHEFRLSNSHRIEEHLADDDHGGDDDGHDEGIDEVLYLAAGDSGQITVTFPEDTTVFTEVACLIPGHYEAGMFAGLSYEG